MKKIIISSYDSLKNPYFGGGGALAIHHLAKALGTKYEVAVLTGNYPNSKNGKLNGVTYHYIGLPFLGPLKLGQAVFVCLLPFYAVFQTYDLWIENFTPPISTAFIPYFTHKKVVGLVHMFSGEDMWRKYKLPFFLIENYGLKAYKNFIVTSTVWKNKILLHNKNASATVIPVGAEKELFMEKRKGQYILFLGRIEYNQKGLDLLLNSYQKIAPNTPLPLVIAGAGVSREEQKVKKQIKKLKLEKKVKMIGRVSGSKKVETLQKAAALVMSSRFETFGTVALEALASETPLVCFDIPGTSWIPNTCATKVKTINANKLAEALEKVLTDKAQTQKKVMEGKKLALQFTWEKIEKKYLETISKILAP